MSAFKSTKQGLSEAAAHAKGKQAGVNEYQPYAVDVADLRRRLGLTQEQFAARFGFSVATLRHWEQIAAHFGIHFTTVGRIMRRGE